LANTPTVLPALTLVGNPIPGALDRQAKVPGFDQRRLSASHVLCIGAGGLVGHIAPTLVRKGVGALTILDDDEVEASNLNRQRFYASDIGKNKAVALVNNLHRECTFATALRAFPLRLEEATGAGVDLSCDVVVVGVDNNPARVLASRTFRELAVPAVFCAVSAQADHGYVFVQEPNGPCFACLFPDALNDERYPCPGTAAMADVLQAVGALAAYAVDTCIMRRTRRWNYRRTNLLDGTFDCSCVVAERAHCSLCGRMDGNPSGRRSCGLGPAHTTPDAGR
jgi:molybdopterin/thiamine biosynthesis adenylyltransferase